MSKKLEQAKDLVDEIAARSSIGMTIEEMANFCGVSRRTAERLRATISDSIVELVDIKGEDNLKHWFIVDKFSSAFSMPSASELAALENEIKFLRESNNQSRSKLLSSLLGKINGNLEQKTRDRAMIDVEALNKYQRIYVPAGPTIEAANETFSIIQNAILMGRMVEFEYYSENYDTPKWRRIIPYGLIHGSISYLIGDFLKGNFGAHTYRIDKMKEVKLSDEIGYPPEDFNLDEFMSQSFGLWQGEVYNIKLLALPCGAQKAKNWRFHKYQSLTENQDGSVTIEFQASGLYELALHLCSWVGELKIIAPKELRDEINDIQAWKF